MPKSLSAASCSHVLSHLVSHEVRESYFAEEVGLAHTAICCSKRNTVMTHGAKMSVVIDVNFGICVEILSLVESETDFVS